jgi:predicted dehydrogenase
MEPVRWGVLSTAKIGMKAVVPGMRRATGSHVVAIASRDAATAAAAAAELGIPRAYGSYEALLADPEIEAIYNPLPNHLHVPWTIRAMEAGKHVLCEKPIALTAAEAETLVAAEARTGRRVAEAFMVRHHPQWRRLREIVRAGGLGEVRGIVTAFSYFLTDPANIRNQPEIGGGGLMDIGCYAITTARYLFGADPVDVVAAVDRDPVMGTDRLTSAILGFPGGRQLAFLCATQLSPVQRVTVMGTTGHAEVLLPFNAHPEREAVLVVDDGRDLYGSGVRRETFPLCDQYGLQADAFSAAIRGEAEIEFPIADAVVNMRIIEAVFRAAETGVRQRL